jgi:hypothetical protein
MNSLPLVWIEQTTLSLQMTRNNHYAKEALMLPGSFDLPTSSYLSIRSGRIREEFYQLKYESHIFYTF